MGKDWYWSRSVARGQEKESSGCMSGMLHFLDFQQLLFTSTSTTSSSKTAATRFSPPKIHRPPPELLKGMEAPRNSLELDERTASTSLAIREEYYDVPVGIQLTVPSAIVAKKKSLLLEEERRSTSALLTERKALFLEEERRSTSAILTEKKALSNLEERSSTEVGTPKTPSLVARLMGLDVMPDQASLLMTHCRGSRSYSAPATPPLLEFKEHSRKKKIKKKQYVDESRRVSPPSRRPLQNRNWNVPPSPPGRLDVGSRSLPDSPRASSGRPWEADHRLSLQLNKENTYGEIRDFNYSGDEVHGEQTVLHSPLPSLTRSKRRDKFRHHQDENKNPSNHSNGSQMVNQVKESINNRKESCGGGEYAIRSVRTRPAAKKASPDGESCYQVKPITMKPPPSCSPPSIRFLEPLGKLKSLGDEDHNQPRPLRLRRPKPPPLPTSSSYRVEAKARMDKCKKPGFERYTEKIKKKSQQSAARRPDVSLVQALPSSSSSPLQPVKTLPSFVTLKTRESTLPPHPMPEKAYLSSSRQSQHDDPINRGDGSLKPVGIQKSHRCYHPNEQDPELQYVRSILVHAGILGRTVPSFHSWHSRSRPIDPVVFHKLELEFPFKQQSEIMEEEKKSILLGPVRHRWNRKLLFHLVQEIIVDLSELSRFNTAHYLFHLLGHRLERRRSIDGESLLQRLWTQIRSFPAADCHVIGDIDALVEGDLPETNVRRLLLHPSVVEEEEDMVVEIERDVLDSLLRETATCLALLRGTVVT